MLLWFAWLLPGQAVQVEVTGGGHTLQGRAAESWQAVSGNCMARILGGSFTSLEDAEIACEQNDECLAVYLVLESATYQTRGTCKLTEPIPSWCVDRGGVDQCNTDPNTVQGGVTFFRPGCEAHVYTCPTCTCSNGRAATGTACTSNHAHICKACSTGFHLSAGKCAAKQCTCRNGRAATGTACTSNHAHICKACSTGFHLSAGKCAAKQCTCSNGAAATGTACTSNNAHICKACITGFHLSAGKCAANQRQVISTFEKSICSAASGLKSYYSKDYESCKELCAANAACHFFALPNALTQCSSGINADDCWLYEKDAQSETCELEGKACITTYQLSGSASIPSSLVDRSRLVEGPDFAMP